MQFRIIIVGLLYSFFFMLYSAPAFAEVPPQPQGPHILCINGLAAVRLNWFPAINATSYRILVTSGQNSSTMSYNSTTTEITIPITPLQQYEWRVYAVNASGSSLEAMDGVTFSCNIPVPTSLHYQCTTDRTISLSWRDTNPTRLYEVLLDTDAPSWDNTCTSPDRCVSSGTNTMTIQIDPTKRTDFRVQATDLKGNKSLQSAPLYINCANPPPTPDDQISPIATPMISPFGTVTPLPTQGQSDYCNKRTRGDANCDGIIDTDDSHCWKRFFSVNILEVSRGCRHTNFDEMDGTNILDYAIWYVHRES